MCAAVDDGPNSEDEPTSEPSEYDPDEEYQQLEREHYEQLTEDERRQREQDEEDAVYANWTQEDQIQADIDEAWENYLLDQDGERSR